MTYRIFPLSITMVFLFTSNLVAGAATYNLNTPLASFLQELFAPGVSPAYAGTRVYVLNDPEAWLHANRTPLAFWGAAAGAKEVREAVMRPGGCADGATTVVAFSIQPSCDNDGNIATDGYVQVSSVVDGLSYEINEGDENDGTGTRTTLSGLTDADFPLQILTGLANPSGSQDYTVRVYTEDVGGNTDCFIDVMVTMLELDITNVNPICSFDATTGQSSFDIEVTVDWALTNSPTGFNTINVELGGQTVPLDVTGMATGSEVVTITNVSGPAYSQFVSATFANDAACSATSLVDLIACTPSCVDGPGTVGGNVFNDDNNDGADAGAGEAGQSNVLVEIYECDEDTPVATTWTNADGDWSVDDANITYPVRVEFSTPLQPELQSSVSGADNGTNTQFVDEASCEVDYGLVDPDEYCQSNPTLFTVCYTNGSGDGSSGFISFDYNSTGQSRDYTTVSTTSQIGSIWGIAYLPPPIQIGNYVWEDTDMDGVQDACEEPVTGLPVTLYTQDDDGTLTQVDMTTTDPVTGEYYFDDVLSDTTYLIVFGDAPVMGDTTFTYDGVEYAVTQDSTGEGTNPELNDSDGTFMTTPLGELPSILVSTADTTDHTLDLGLTPTSVFDLALVKRLDLSTNPGPFSPGGIVDFTVTVYNQGDTDATDIEVKDYVPEGLSLAPASAPNWTVSVDTAILTTPFSLAAGEDSVLNISFVIDADFMGDTLVNRSEISNFDDDNDPSTDPPVDEDSTPNDNGMDDPEADTPDEFDDDGDGTPGTEDNPNDEDDYDWEGIPVMQNFDLNLVKRIDTMATPGPFTYGSTVTYTIEVRNQGSLDATDVEVADYVPDGLSLVADVDWLMDVDTARTTTV